MSLNKAMQRRAELAIKRVRQGAIASHTQSVKSAPPTQSDPAQPVVQIVYEVSEQGAKPNPVPSSERHLEYVCILAAIAGATLVAGILALGVAISDIKKSDHQPISSLQHECITT